MNMGTSVIIKFIHSVELKELAEFSPASQNVILPRVGEHVELDIYDEFLKSSQQLFTVTMISHKYTDGFRTIVSIYVKDF